eukprot:Nitzschia sp. Nitz4//scaffold105_size73764//35042//36226//NITZ4_005676-RA/size73764-augustus-gene-0.50-mRNA-1//1//CDS//3329532447//7507//frame0
MSRLGGTLEGLGGPVNMDKYSLDGIDPTLDVCCQREVQSNRKYNALKSTLQRHDIAALAERRRRHMVTTPGFEGCRCCYDPNVDGLDDYPALMQYRQDHPSTTGNTIAAFAEPEVPEDPPSEPEDSDDEFDYLLDDIPGDQDLEDPRRAELEFDMLARQMALQHGYGAHRPIHPTRVLQVAGLGSNRTPPMAVAVHLVDPQSEASASLDVCLEDLATQNAGTMFLRSAGRTTLLMNPAAKSSLPPLGPEDLPALVAIRDGVAINVCHQLKGLSAHEGDLVESHAVRMWLEQSGVLLSTPPPYHELCFIRPEEEALLDFMAAGAPPAVEERYDCGVDGCCKPFFHEHVGIQNSQQDGLIVKEDDVVEGNA